MALRISICPVSKSSTEFSRSCLSKPLPMVALPCGSRSITSTRRLVATSEAARLMQVVVLPTPPFWFAMAKTLPIACLPIIDEKELKDAFVPDSQEPEACDSYPAGNFQAIPVTHHRAAPPSWPASCYCYHPGGWSER